MTQHADPTFLLIFPDRAISTHRPDALDALLTTSPVSPSGAAEARGIDIRVMTVWGEIVSHVLPLPPGTSIAVGEAVLRQLSQEMLMRRADSDRTYSSQRHLKLQQLVAYMLEEIAEEAAEEAAEAAATKFTSTEPCSRGDQKHAAHPAAQGPTAAELYFDAQGNLLGSEEPLFEAHGTIVPAALERAQTLCGMACAGSSAAAHLCGAAALAAQIGNPSLAHSLFTLLQESAATGSAKGDKPPAALSPVVLYKVPSRQPTVSVDGFPDPITAL
jgi:hypothetical protein